MKHLTYREFLDLVLQAAGPFSYRFDRYQLVCDPTIFLAMHYPNGLGSTRREIAR